MSIYGKADQNSVLLGPEGHIPDWLYIIVLYISFYGFKKNQFFDQNPKGLAFCFTEKRQFAAKIDRNSLSLVHKVHIPNW
jgi:hypothetical protein